MIWISGLEMSIWVRQEGHATMTLAPSARKVIDASQAGQVIALAFEPAAAAEEGGIESLAMASALTLTVPAVDLPQIRESTLGELDKPSDIGMNGIGPKFDRRELEAVPLQIDAESRLADGKNFRQLAFGALTTHLLDVGDRELSSANTPDCAGFDMCCLIRPRNSLERVRRLFEGHHQVTLRLRKPPETLVLEQYAPLVPAPLFPDLAQSPDHAEMTAVELTDDADLQRTEIIRDVGYPTDRFQACVGSDQ
jgi:hypothetical protein